MTAVQIRDAALLQHQRARGIFVNGQEISWGYEAPQEGIREAIKQEKCNL